MRNGKLVGDARDHGRAVASQRRPVRSDHDVAVRRGHSAEPRQRMPCGARAADRRSSRRRRRGAGIGRLRRARLHAGACGRFRRARCRRRPAHVRHRLPAEARDAQEGERAALHPARAAQAGRARARRRDRCAAASDRDRARSPLYRLDRNAAHRGDARAGRGGVRVRDRRLRDRDRRSGPGTSRSAAVGRRAMPAAMPARLRDVPAAAGGRGKHAGMPALPPKSRAPMPQASAPAGSPGERRARPSRLRPKRLPPRPGSSSSGSTASSTWWANW